MAHSDDYITICFSLSGTVAAFDIVVDSVVLCNGAQLEGLGAPGIVAIRNQRPTLFFSATTTTTLSDIVVSASPGVTGAQ
jgi:hypothetical protein